MASSSADEILTELKPFGRIQKGFLISSAFIQFFLPMNSQSVNFLAATPNHHCSSRDGYCMNQSIPLEEDEIAGREVYSQCQEYVDPENQSMTQDCQDGWEYDRSVYGETIISEWDLVCNDNAAAELSQSMYSIGGIFGSVIFGMIADRYGRRPAFLLAMTFFNISGIALCFSPNFIVFVVLRFFGGFFLTAELGMYSMVVGCVYLTHWLVNQAAWLSFSTSIAEYMIPKYRSRAMTVPAISLSFGLMFMAILAFFIRDWRYLQLAIILQSTIGMFALWYFPESLRWLMGTGDHEKVTALVHKLAKINKTKTPPNVIFSNNSAASTDNEIFTISTNRADCDSSNVNSLKEVNSEEHTAENLSPSTRDLNSDESCMHRITGTELRGIDSENLAKTDPRDTSRKIQGFSYLDLFKPPLLHVTIVLSITRYTFLLVYLGFALGTGRLAGNPYLNFFLSSLVEVPARMLSPLAYKRFRRTHVMALFFTICGVGLVAMMVVPKETKNGVDISIFGNILAFLGKFFVTLTLGGLLLLVMELFPTNMRNNGNGFTLAMGRVGATVAPFMLYLDTFIPNVSMMIMACMSIVTAMSVLTLPDTRRTPQPQNADDLRQIMKSKKKNDNMIGKENKAFDGVSTAL